MRAGGYRVVMFFLWLPNVEMAVARVRKRVAEGGHDVADEDIRRRFTAGIQNLFRLYRAIAHDWWLYDASRLPPKVIAIEVNGQLVVKQIKQFRRIEEQAEKIRETDN
jgi:predicted ABC-type ATPase